MLDRTINELIGAIYDAALDAELWVDVLNQVRAITPCRVASLYSLDRLTDKPTIHQSVGMDVAEELAFLRNWGSNNPISGVVGRLEPGQVHGFALTMDYEAFKQTAVFRQWGEPNGFCDVINVMLENTASRLGAVSLLRGVEDGPADQPALARLEVLAPHFLRAARIGRVLENATLRERTFERTLDALASAVLLIGPTGGLIYANAVAQKLMRAGLPLRRIAEAAVTDQACLVTLADGVRRTSHCLPLGRLGAGQAGGRLQACRVVVLKEEARIDSAIASAAAVYGLTQRECDVLFGLFESGGVPAISRLLGISRNTVNTHMKRLFAKTGTQRQAELAGLISNLVSPLVSSASYDEISTERGSRYAIG